MDLSQPRILSEVQALIRWMTRENPTWSAVRIVGELRALGIDGPRLPAGSSAPRILVGMLALLTLL